ncbi:MAG: MFS transporter [Lentilactobacillus diolivorans]
MHKKQKLIIFSMMIGIFLCMLDTTVMNIALPAIQSDLNVNLGNLSWALNIYTITFAVFTIPFGRIADIVGRNKMYVFGLILFALGSLLSGSANRAEFLITGRGIQSLGAAIIFPASMTIGISTADVKHRTDILAALGVTQGFASAFGPTIGGVVTQYLGWRYVFLINLPLILIVLILCVVLLPLKNEHRFKAKIDLWGMLFSMGTLFNLTLALVKGNDWGWSSHIIVGLFIAAVISLIGFIVAEHFTKDPMVPLTLFKSRQFTGASLVTVLTEIFLVAVLVIMPTFFTNILNKSELIAAFMITPTSLMIFIFSPIGGLLNDKIGPRLLVSVGFLQIIIGYIVLSVINPANYGQTIISLVLIGGGFGIIAGPLVVLGASNFTGKLLSASQSVLGVFRQVGTLLAVAIFVSALTANLATARSQSITQANTQIETTQLSAKAKTDVAANVKKAISDNGKTTDSNSAQGITPKKTNQLIQSNYQQAIAKIPNAKMMPKKQKALIHTKIAKLVKKTVAKQNLQISTIAKIIKSNTKQNMTNAFMKLYKMALPFAVIAALASFLFERKRDYLK